MGLYLKNMQTEGLLDKAYWQSQCHPITYPIGMRTSLKMHVLCFSQTITILCLLFFYQPFELCHVKLFKGERIDPVFSNNPKIYSKGLQLEHSRKSSTLSYCLMLHSEPYTMFLYTILSNLKLIMCQCKLTDNHFKFSWDYSGSQVFITETKVLWRELSKGMRKRLMMTIYFYTIFLWLID